MSEAHHIIGIERQPKIVAALVETGHPRMAGKTEKTVLPDGGITQLGMRFNRYDFHGVLSEQYPKNILLPRLMVIEYRETCRNIISLDDRPEKACWTDFLPAALRNESSEILWILSNRKPRFCPLLPDALPKTEVMTLSSRLHLPRIAPQHGC
jgi:hypothetical protein